MMGHGTGMPPRDGAMGHQSMSHGVLGQLVDSRYVATIAGLVGQRVDSRYVAICTVSESSPKGPWGGRRGGLRRGSPDRRGGRGGLRGGSLRGFSCPVRGGFPNIPTLAP